MTRRRRICFTAAQKSEIWDRSQRGESMSSIGRSFERGYSCDVHSVPSPDNLLNVECPLLAVEPRDGRILADSSPVVRWSVFRIFLDESYRGTE